MDTIPFHLILLAADVLVIGGLFLWIRHRRNAAVVSATYQYEKSFFVPEVKVRQPSLLWDLSGCVLFGGLWFFCFAVFSRLIFTDTFQKHVYNFNVGQCIVEGLFYHGVPIFFAAGGLLFWNKRKFFGSAALCAAVLFGALGYDVLWYEPYALVVEHYTIETPKLKNKVRVVFVADIQTDVAGYHEKRTLEKIKQQNADLIIFGGDYIQVFPGTPHADKIPQELNKLFADAKFTDEKFKPPLGAYAIHGNIGGMDVDKILFKNTGIEYISSSTVFGDLGIDKGIGPIDVVILGLGDSRSVPDSPMPKELSQTGNFMIMAGHYPNYAINGFQYKTEQRQKGYKELPEAPDLMLAGHTHGGQISIPFYGTTTWSGDNFVRQIPRSMMSGFFVYPNGGHLLVSRGSGMERGWAPRIRFNCPSEISVIDLLPANPPKK